MVVFQNLEDNVPLWVFCFLIFLASISDFEKSAVNLIFAALKEISKKCFVLFSAVAL